MIGLGYATWLHKLNFATCESLTKYVDIHTCEERRERNIITYIWQSDNYVVITTKTTQHHCTAGITTNTTLPITNTKIL